MQSPSITELIGKKLEDVKDFLEPSGMRLRVVNEDGKALMVTRDFRSDRYNLTVVDGVVTDAYVG